MSVIGRSLIAFLVVFLMSAGFVSAQSFVCNSGDNFVHHTSSCTGQTNTTCVVYGCTDQSQRRVVVMDTAFNELESYQLDRVGSFSVSFGPFNESRSSMVHLEIRNSDNQRVGDTLSLHNPGFGSPILPDEDPTEGGGSCNPMAGNLNLIDCFTLGIFSNQTVGSFFGTPTQLVNLIVTNLFIVAGLIFLVMIIYAGFLFINDTTKGKDDAVSVIVTATKGLIVMFVAYWLVQIIELVTGVAILF